MPGKHSLAILGAGITGLSIAYALKKRGIKVTVYEKNAQVGGVIQSQKEHKWLVEKGPNTMFVRNPKVWDLLDELNLSNQIIEADEKAKERYIIRNGKLCHVPTSIPDFITTGLLSTSAKLRLLKEPFISPASKADETIADFIRRRLGTEPLDYGVNPFVAGVYAADPRQLSIKHTFSVLHELEQRYGSIAKGLFKKRGNKNTKRVLLSFDDGMQALPKAMQQKLGKSVCLNTQVKRIEQTLNAWSVTVNMDKKEINNEHTAIISTLPPYQLSSVLRGSKSKQHLQKISKINYAPISVIALGFKKEQINHPLDGFGMLIPGKEPFNLLGCLFSSSLFPNRAPNNHTLLTCFIGGTGYPELAKESAELLVSKSINNLRQLLGVNGSPVFTHHTYWPYAIPQFNVGYDAHLKAFENIEQENPGLFISGNFRNGVSVSDCVLAAYETAKQVEMFLT